MLHEIRANPLPPTGFLEQIFGKNRVQQHHMPRTHQLWAYSKKQTDINGAFSLYYSCRFVLMAGDSATPSPASKRVAGKRRAGS